MPASDLIIVEDGSNVPGSNSYISYQEFIDYCTLYNYVEALELDESEQVAAIIKAADLVDSYKFRGEEVHSDQNMSFPRKNCVPVGSIRPIHITDIPKSIRKAQLAASTISASGIDLQPTIQSSDFVTREKVGPIETEYSDSLKSGMTTPIFSFVDSILSNYLSSGGNGKYAISTLRV